MDSSMSCVIVHLHHLHDFPTSAGLLSPIGTREHVENTAYGIKYLLQIN